MHGCGPGPGAKDSSAQNHLIPKHGPKPMLFVFGDSYADTGNIRKSLSSSWKQPYGLTFPGKPAGRFSDGRVLTDYIGKSFKSFICIIIDSTSLPISWCFSLYFIKCNTTLYFFLKKNNYDAKVVDVGHALGLDTFRYYHYSLCFFGIPQHALSAFSFFLV